MGGTTASPTGAYDLDVACHILGVTPASLLALGRPSRAGLPPIVQPSLGWAYSFHDLVTVAVAAVLKQRSVHLASIRRSHAWLQQQHGVARPFARRDLVENLSTMFGSVIAVDDGIDTTRAGQMVLLGAVQKFLVPLSYDHDLLARLWQPEPQVLLDPSVQVGQPCVTGSRILTTTVAGRYLQGTELLSTICEDLDITMTQARAAIDFEKKLAMGQGLARLTNSRRSASSSMRT